MVGRQADRRQAADPDYSPGTESPPSRPRPPPGTARPTTRASKRLPPPGPELDLVIHVDSDGERGWNGWGADEDEEVRAGGGGRFDGRGLGLP